MTDTLEIVQPPVDNTFKKYIPILTTICCLASIVLFIGISLEKDPGSWDTYKRWGYFSAIDIFDGSYWGLITSNFLHTKLWHIFFNLYWLWIFGKKIEFESSKAFYGLLILSSALVSSLSELSFADSTGIGLSGIGYSLFGFLWIKSRFEEAYKNYLDRKTIGLFILWLFICIILTQTRIWNVGNAAHIGGVLWGMTLAYISRFDNYKQWIIGFILFSALASSIFWSPFSVSWLSYRAFELHQDQRFEEAVSVYQKILSRDPESEFAKVNLQQLEVYELQKKALELHKSEKYKEAKEIYYQILKIDKENQWAKDNLKLLPE